EPIAGRNRRIGSACPRGVRRRCSDWQRRCAAPSLLVQICPRETTSRLCPEEYSGRPAWCACEFCRSSPEIRSGRESPCLILLIVAAQKFEKCGKKPHFPSNKARNGAPGRTLVYHERHFRFKRAMLGTLGEDRPASQPYLRFPQTSGQGQGRFRYFVLRHRADPRPNRCRRGSRLPTRLLLSLSPQELTGVRRRTLWP